MPFKSLRFGSSRLGRRHDIAEFREKIFEIIRADIFKLGQNAFDNRCPITFAFVRLSVHLGFMNDIKGRAWTGNIFGGMPARA